MASSTAAQKRVNTRKAPKQQRSSETVAALVEAAARVLERHGFEGFNTNAVADKAGVSVGSLYQYFPGKHALLSALIEREMQPLLAAVEDLGHITDFPTALHLYVEAAVRNQMRRPELARLMDLAEKQEIFHEQITSTVSRFLAVLERMLALPGAPPVADRALASADLVAIARALTDVAGERGEKASSALVRRIEGTVYGYLHAAGM